MEDTNYRTVVILSILALLVFLIVSWECSVCDRMANWSEMGPAG